MTDTEVGWTGTSHHRTASTASAADAATRRGTARTAGPRRPGGRDMRGRGVDEWLTVEEVCAELNIGRRTFERWRTLGIAPRATRPTRNGPLRIKRSWLNEWAENGAS